MVKFCSNETSRGFLAFKRMWRVLPSRVDSLLHAVFFLYDQALLSVTVISVKSFGLDFTHKILLLGFKTWCKVSHFSLIKSCERLYTKKFKIISRQKVGLNK